jgi:hypothetical protein
MKEKWIGICALYMLLPFLAFYTMAGFEDSSWQQVYYYWDKSKDVLLLYVLFRLSDKAYKGIPLAACIFAIIRLIWHIISGITGISINHNTWINFLFATLVLTCVIAVVSEWRKLK